MGTLIWWLTAQVLRRQSLLPSLPSVDIAFPAPPLLTCCCWLCCCPCRRSGCVALRQQYSAERMSLVVLGGQDLDTLQSWVAASFGDIPRGTAGPPPSFDHVGLPFEVRGGLWALGDCLLGGSVEGTVGL